MKFSRILLFSLLFFTLFSAFTMKNKDKDKPVYVFGIAASFADTVVYYTQIQLLDSVRLNKNGFLPQREVYASQLKSFLEYSKQKPNYTCMIYFSENKGKLEKEATKLQDRYRQNKSLVEPIDSVEFLFKKPQK